MLIFYIFAGAFSVRSIQAARDWLGEQISS